MFVIFNHFFIEKSNQQCLNNNIDIYNSLLITMADNILFFYMILNI
jgi:hypothetical protein